MTGFTLGPAAQLARDCDCFDAMARVWNLACERTHGFFPLTAELLRLHMETSPHWDPALLMIARDDHTGRWLGFAHAVIVDESYYPVCGAIEVVCVIPEARRQGIATALVSACVVALRRRGQQRIEGGGSWPNCPLYATLIDGSERAGVDLCSPGLVGAFMKNGFQFDRKSIRMRIDDEALMRLSQTPIAEGMQQKTVSRRGETTWLDYCFRRWDLSEHHLCDGAGHLLSRCITSSMHEPSRIWGKAWHSIFGVFCAVAQRRKGYALIGLAIAAKYVLEQGGQGMELHVLASNAPAIGLYRKAGFRPVGETVSMTLQLA